MNKAQVTFELEKELENLREKLNKEIIKNMKHRSKEEYKDLLTTSRELDDIIVNYMKRFNK